MSVVIGLIKLIEPSDAFNYKLFLKIAFYKLILDVFLLFIFMWNTIFCSKNWAYKEIIKRNKENKRNVK